MSVYKFESEVLNTVIQEVANETKLTFSEVYDIYITPYLVLKDIARRKEPEKVIVREFGTFSPNIMNLRDNGIIPPLKDTKKYLKQSEIDKEKLKQQNK